MKRLEKVQSLLKAKEFYVVDGRAHFTDTGNTIWVSVDTDIGDGCYMVRNGELISLLCTDRDEVMLGRNLGVDLDGVFGVVDVKGIPYGLVNFVSKDDIKRKALQGIYIDGDHKCIIGTNGQILYSHDLEGIESSMLLRSVFWKLIYYFNLTQICSDGKNSISRGDGVTVISKLMDLEMGYPSVFECIPQGIGVTHIEHIEITDDIKGRVITAIKVLKSRCNRFTDRVFIDGAYIKCCGYKVNIGVELFPGKVFCLSAFSLEVFLKIAHGWINFPDGDRCNLPVVIRDQKSVSLIMPFRINSTDFNKEFIELQVS